MLSALSPPTAILTRSGAMVDLLNPQPADIHITDIAYALARIVRFGGHAPGWSVAQHSIAVARQSPPGFALEGLLHDAAEAYVGDVTRPLKSMLGATYKTIEERVEIAIASRFNLQWPWPVTVKAVDDAMCQSEMGCFWPSRQNGTPSDYQPVDALAAEVLFLAEFKRLARSSK